MKDRIEGWLGGTYRIFQKPKGLFKLFQTKPYSDEAYARSINLFRRYLAQTDTTRKTPVKLEENQFGQFVPEGTEYYEKAKFLVDDIINQVQIKGKPAGLPESHIKMVRPCLKKTLKVYQVEVVKYLENYLVK